VEQRGLPPPAFCGGARRHRQVQLAGDAGDGEQRRQGVLGGGEDPGPGALPEPGDLPRGAEAQVAAAEDLETAVQAIAGVLREEGICR
jgi:hypothetical protein